MVVLIARQARNICPIKIILPKKIPFFDINPDWLRRADNDS